MNSGYDYILVKLIGMLCIFIIYQLTVILVDKISQWLSERAQIRRLEADENVRLLLPCRDSVFYLRGMNLFQGCTVGQYSNARRWKTILLAGDIIDIKTVDGIIYALDVNGIVRYKHVNPFTVDDGLKPIDKLPSEYLRNLAT